MLELDLNPLIVQPEGKGVISVDARAFVGLGSQPSADLGEIGWR